MAGNEQRTDPTSPPSPYWLRRVDQAALAGIVLVLLVTLAGYWLARGGHRGQVIDFDLSEPLDARYQIDVNAAELGEWMALPEIGESLAKAVVEHRAAHGPFHSPEDLLAVRGIGVKTLDKLRPYLRGFAGEKESVPHDAPR